MNVPQDPGLMMLGRGYLAGDVTSAAFRLHCVKEPAQDTVQWATLSEQAIQSALAQHKRVFVDVTADWCITCKVNK